MCRILAWGLVLLMPLPAAWSGVGNKDDDQGLKVEGKLSPDDAKDKVLTKSPHRVHTLKMRAAETYQIDLVSRAFDALLRVEDESGHELAADDDSGGGRNARIYLRVPKDGSYRLIVTSFDGNAGPYALTAKIAFGTTAAAIAAFSAVQHDFQKHNRGAVAKLYADYLKAETDDAKDKVVATFAQEMEDFANRYARIAKKYRSENVGKQAAVMAKQVQFTASSTKSQIVFAAGNMLRDQYEKAYQAKAKDADDLYQKARTYFADAAKKHADNRVLANRFQDALYLLEKLAIGKVAPEIAGEDLDGRKFKLSDYRGKVVVLDFWGNW